jgi:general secretion pathway protein D
LFLTPYIIRDQSDYRRIFERKMAERSEFVKRFYGADEGYQKAVDYERKTTMLSRLRRGVQTELSRAEHGGPGTPDERVIVPSRGEAPPETPPRYAPPSPAPLTPEGTGPPPGTQETPSAPEPQQGLPPDQGRPQPPPNGPQQSPPPEEPPPPRS